ncbi:MAG: hypothetical protein ACRD5G_17160 [Candidatus Acidiferrales bacterium]
MRETVLALTAIAEQHLLTLSPQERERRIAALEAAFSRRCGGRGKGSVPGCQA